PGVVKSLRRTRDPVTTICSSIGFPSAVGPIAVEAGGGSCGTAPGAGGASVDGGVSWDCAAATPADKRRIEATWTVVRFGFICCFPRSSDRESPCGAARRTQTTLPHLDIATPAPSARSGGDVAG